MASMKNMCANRVFSMHRASIDAKIANATGYFTYKKFVDSFRFFSLPIPIRLKAECNNFDMSSTITSCFKAHRTLHRVVDERNRRLTTIIKCFFFISNSKFLIFHFGLSSFLEPFHFIACSLVVNVGFVFSFLSSRLRGSSVVLFNWGRETRREEKIIEKWRKKTKELNSASRCFSFFFTRFTLLRCCLISSTRTGVVIIVNGCSLCLRPGSGREFMRHFFRSLKRFKSEKHWSFQLKLLTHSPLDVDLRAAQQRRLFAFAEWGILGYE